MPVEVLPEMTIAWPNIKWPKRICVDLDGCVVQYDFPKIVKNFFGVDLSTQMIYAYDLADVLGVAPALINTMFREQVYGKPNFIDGAIDTLTELSKTWDIVIYSNRIKYMGGAGLRGWMIDYNIPFRSITDGSGVYDVHVDDSPGKLMSTDSQVKLLFEQPWNQRCHNITGKIGRIKSWQEVKNVCASLDN